ASEVVRQGTDVFGDGHVVVVEHDQQVHRQAASVIERLEGHAGGHGAVTDDRHRAARLAFALGGDRHAQGSADRGARVTHAKGVVGAFTAAREGGQPV